MTMFVTSSVTIYYHYHQTNKTIKLGQGDQGSTTTTTLSKEDAKNSVGILYEHVPE